MTSEILGYGEDALTLWALRNRLKVILDRFRDRTRPSECLIFYRPSFGRRSRRGSSTFGEFDAIIASRTSIFLVESKWDNLSKVQEEELVIRKEQLMRHNIFAWYLTHYSECFRGKWGKFVEENEKHFRFQGKTLPRANSLLSRNLEYIILKLQQHCTDNHGNSIKNVLLYFYKKPPTPSLRVKEDYTLIPIDYAEIYGGFIPL